MQQIKIFVGLEGETRVMSDEINAWIRDSNVRIQQITGNIAAQSIAGVERVSPLSGVGGTTPTRAPSDIIVILLYEEA